MSAMKRGTNAASFLRDHAARLGIGLAVACAFAVSSGLRAAQPAEPAAAKPAVKQRLFNTPEEASEALIVAAEHFDLAALTEILGPDATDLILTEDAVQDKNTLTGFAAQAREKTAVARDAGKPKVAIMTAGAEDWPLPIPIVEKGGKWRFDTKAGRQELLYRRIGGNELDAIEVCQGYVEAQHDYASEKRDGAAVNQYAQRVVSTPGRQDGLAWKAEDGTWQGPVGEGIARVIAEGYSDRYEPYHGYYFKVLKKQGPFAPMGEMDFVIKGVMIGGFALVAAPAEYGVTGLKTFIVSHTGVVYEKDLGKKTRDQFSAMDRFDPDRTWTPLPTP
jgi:hypothetical protein